MPIAGKQRKIVQRRDYAARSLSQPEPLAAMLEFDTNTLAFMTAALEQSCKKLNDDNPEARKFIAERLKQCARTGRKSMAALAEAGDDAVAELNGSPGSSKGWRSWLSRWRQAKPV